MSSSFNQVQITHQWNLIHYIPIPNFGISYKDFVNAFLIRFKLFPTKANSLDFTFKTEISKIYNI